MKYTIMECPICKKRFSTEYYAGGYIDHVENFSNRLVRAWKNSIDCTKKNIKYYFDKIYYCGEDIRDKEDIDCRLNCFLHAESVCDELKRAVSERVNSVIGKKETVKEMFSSLIKNFIQSLTDDEFSVFENFANESEIMCDDTVEDIVKDLCETESEKREANGECDVDEDEDEEDY